MADGRIEPSQGAGKNVFFSSPLITHHFPAFDTDQRGGITGSP